MRQCAPADVLNPPRSNQAAIDAELADAGLTLRGGFNFTEEGAPAASMLLVGNVGGAFWPIFQRWRAGRPPNLKNPLDSWSREIIEAVAQRRQARAVFPSDKPYLPFQQWSMRAEGLRSSPLNILIHPEYGVWHAYRGALLFDWSLDFPAHEPLPHLCDTCLDEPCRKACPVSAHAADFAYRSCLDHVRGVRGEPCRTSGCLDRNACPYGVNYRYPKEMQAFIMAAFSQA